MEYALANAGAILYLRTCGIKSLKSGIKFTSRAPANILNVIQNDSFLLFLLGEDAKQIEIFSSGKHKEKAIAYYKLELQKNGLEKAWEKLKLDLFIFLNQILSEHDKQWAPV